MNKIILSILFVLTLLLCFVSWQARSQVVCGNDDDLLVGLEEKYGERVVEQGIDEQTLVIITVNVQRHWTILVSPKDKPNTLCVLATGRHWTQDEFVSKGIAHDGSVVSFIYKEDRTWTMMYYQKNTKTVKEITTGYAWERLIDLTSKNKI